MSQALLSLWEMLYCISSKRNHEILVETIPQGAVGIGRHLGCLYGNNAVQTDALLIHLVQYGQCHMEFEYTEQGSVHGRYTGACLLCLSIRLYQRWLFLAIEQTVNPGFQVQTFAARDDGSYTSE